MTGPVADRPSMQSRRPPPTIWLAAAAEVLVAGGVVWILVRTGRGAGSRGDHHTMNGVLAARTDVAVTHWGWLPLTAAVVAAVGAMWWLSRRSAAAAVVAVAGLCVLAAAPSVRALATQSHLVFMVVLEVTTTAIPLVVIFALARPGPSQGVNARSWPSIWVLSSTVVYALLLIGVHLPAFHDYLMTASELPWWTVALAGLVGTTYWASVLRSPAAVGMRRTGLFVGQEVAALIGLATAFGGGAVMTMPGLTALGLSAVWDQRLGGVVMLVSCAAVSVPVLQRLPAGSTSGR